ncbi:thioredoxin family protein [Candidatus Woesearchaeota archaeon]|nr:thioredoxin family protein [Candidatus Woesearchaeota archaeon]
MVVKIFWQEQCPNCPPAKELGRKLETNGVDVAYYDVKDLVGLTHAIKHSIRSTPAVVVADDDDRELKIWRSKVPSLDEVKSFVTK